MPGEERKREIEREMGREREKEGQREREGGKGRERDRRGRAEEKGGSEFAKVTKCEKDNNIKEACFTCTFFFFQERVYRPTESRQMGVIDPHNRIMVLHLYAGLLKVCIK